MRPETVPRNCVEFMGVEILLAAGVLAPRAETELLGQVAIKILRERSGPRRAIDMCCGSGNLVCAVATVVDELTAWACDLTDDAVALTRRNVSHLNLAGRVRVCQGDLFSALQSEALEGRVDLVICNPPYISTSRLAGDRSHLLVAEPREAFDGGPYGLSIHQRVIREALCYLKPGGWVALEFGEGQQRQLEILSKRSGGYSKPQFLVDGAGIPRVMTLEKTVS